MHIANKKGCSKCGKTKPLDEYGLDARGRFGRQARCRECYREAKAEKRRRQRASGQYVERKEKRCPQCKDTLPIDSFCRASGQADGRHGICRECNRKKRAAIIDYIRAAKEKQHFTCATCSNVCDADALEFAHRSREEKHVTRNGKTLGISEMRSIKAVDKELPKGRFLCWKCHMLETWKETHENDDTTSPAQTPGRIAVEKEKQLRGKCNNCQEALPESKRLWPGFHFDHRDRTTKKGCISAIVITCGESIDALITEMAKCDFAVRCLPSQENQGMPR